MGRSDDPIEAAFAGLLAGGDGVRESLRESLHLAREAADPAGASRAALLLLLHTLVDFADFRGLAQALQAFDPALLHSDADRRRADASLLGRPLLDHAHAFDAPDVLAARERLFACVRDGDALAPDERLLLAKVLVDYDDIAGHRPDENERVLLLMQHVLPRASGRWQAIWWRLSATQLEYAGHPELARAAAEELRALAARLEHPELALSLACADLRLALQADDLPRAERASRAIERERPRVRAALVPRGLSAQASLLLRRGEHAAALQRCQLILALCADHEVPARDCGLYHEQRAHALTGLGRYDEAAQVLEALRETQHASQGRLLEAILAMLRAVQALDAGAPGARDAALHAVRLAAGAGLHGFLASFPAWAGRIAAIGLDAGMESAFLCAAIRERRLPPPQPWREDWPWPLQVHVLGTPRLTRAGMVLAGEAGGRSARRPMALLSLLAAHPGGLPAGAVIDALWPSLEADAPRASLEMAVSRLRKALDMPDALRVADGRIALDPTRVWTDVAAFEAAAQAGEVEAALRLYAGPLLHGERLEGPMARARERLAARLAACVLQAAGAAREAGRPEAAMAMISRGLAVEPGSAALRAAMLRG